MHDWPKVRNHCSHLFRIPLLVHPLDTIQPKQPQSRRSCQVIERKRNPPSFIMAKRELTELEVADLKEAFATFDVNGDGEIDCQEIRQALLDLGQDPTDDEVMAMFRSVDVNGDNKIDFEDFVFYMKPRISKPVPDKELRDAFDSMFDENEDGLIDRTELKHALERLLGRSGEKLSSKQLDAMIDTVDITGNGKIGFAEFKVMMLF